MTDEISAVAVTFSGKISCTYQPYSRAFRIRNDLSMHGVGLQGQCMLSISPFLFEPGTWDSMTSTLAGTQHHRYRTSTAHRKSSIDSARFSHCPTAGKLHKPEKIKKASNASPALLTGSDARAPPRAVDPVIDYLR